MSNILLHKKHIDTTLYPDSGDATKFQPSDYNDGHVFTGGTNGQVVVRDTSDVTYGAKFTSYPSIDGGISTMTDPVSPVQGQWWVRGTGTSPRTVDWCIFDQGVVKVLFTRTDP